MTEVKFKRLALVGIGLIGSSIARSARKNDLADEIVCAARTADSRRVAKELGIVDATIPEPMGGAHRNVEQMAERVQAHLVKQLERLEQIPLEDMLEQRYQRLMSYGN